MAALLIETVTLALAPGLSVPLVDERVTQLCAFAAVQLRGEPPELVSVYAIDEGLNGPPTVPEEVNPPAGNTANWPMLLTVSETGRDVLPLPVVVLAKFTVSL